MGWFEEQIRQRAESDGQVLEDSFFRMASAVLDSRSASLLEDALLNSREALGEILRYFRRAPVEIPEHITDPKEQLEYVLRPTGLMTRDVELRDCWWKDASGPMLGFLRESGAPVALLPGPVCGYRYRDPATGRKVRVSRKNAGLLEPDAVCFYLPLPLKAIGIPDLLRYIRSTLSRRDVLLLALAALIAALIGLIEPRVYGQVTGSLLKTRNTALLGGMAAFLLASAFSSRMILVIRDLLMNRISRGTPLAVEASVMMRILALPVSFFRGFSSGDLASRTSSVSSLCTLTMETIFSAGLSSVVSLVYIPQLFGFGPALGLPALLVILASLVLSVSAALVQARVSREKMSLSAREKGMSYALVNGIRKIRLAGAEKRVFARWGRLYAQSARLEYNPPLFLKLNPVFTLALSLGGNLLLYHLAIRTGVAQSEYYAFSAAYGRISGAFTALAGLAVSAAAIRPLLAMAEPILAAEPEVAAEKQAVEKVSGQVELSHVSFRYDSDSPWVLNDLSLSIRPGEYVALVGRTGCGKSTLVRLLLGFEKPEKGAVYYDRHDLARLDPRSLRKHIGVVIQNGALFQGDIYSNIAVSAPGLTMDQAWEAAETAGIAQDIREMPMGMHTLISEDGGGISGGQKQRLLIARAIASRPKVLIFDEATSALDNRTQKQVSDALDRLKCTRLVIAHRLSTVRNCSRILVMDGGAIVEEGTYEELIRLNGRFAELVARQRLDTADGAD